MRQLPTESRVVESPGAALAGHAKRRLCRNAVHNAALLACGSARICVSSVRVLQSVCGRVEGRWGALRKG